MMTRSIPFAMMAGAALLMACGSDDDPNMNSTGGGGATGGTTSSGGSGGTGGGEGGQGGAVVAPDPEAVWITSDELVFEELMPGLVSFAKVVGDYTVGAHWTFARVTAGMGLPSHSHTMGAHALNFGGPMEIPVPSDQTNPPSLMLGSYVFVPPGAEHAMNCTDSMTDCLFLIQQDGPFDMTPETPAGGNPPIDVNPSAVQTPFGDINFIEIMPDIVEFGPVRGDFSTGAHGTIVRVFAGKGLPPHWHTAAVHGFVLSGQMNVPIPYNQTDVTDLDAGSYFYVPAAAEHEMNCVSDSDCMFFVDQDAAFDMNLVEMP